MQYLPARCNCSVRPPLNLLLGLVGLLLECRTSTLVLRCCRTMQHLRTTAVPLAVLKASTVLQSHLLGGDGDAYEGDSRMNVSV